MNKKTYITKLLLILGVVIAINLVFSELNFRIDFTEDNQFTLSDATKNILKNLEEPVTIKAYFSEGLRPEIGKAKVDFRDLLVEYAERSDGMVAYSFINPGTDPEIEQEALQNGVSPINIVVREKDQQVQKQAYLGAVIEVGDQKEVLPVITAGAAMEYDLSSSIKKLTVLNKPTIGFVQGNGETELQQLGQVLEQLSYLYNVVPVDLNDSIEISLEIKTLAIVAPTDTLNSSELASLDKFLERGGNLFIALNHIKGDLQTFNGALIITGIEDWLQQKGIVVENNVLVDATCHSITMQQQRGFMTFRNQVQFPFFPLVQKFSDHPITKGIEQVIMPFASTIQYTGDTATSFEAIALSSAKSGTMSAPFYIDAGKQWIDSDFPFQHLAVGAVIEGNLVGSIRSRIVVFSDADFGISGDPQRPQRLPEDNISLFANSIDWLSDDTGLISLRTKGISSRPIKAMEEGTRSTLKWLNFLLPIILVIIYGLVRVQIKKTQKLKRMSERYV